MTILPIPLWAAFLCVVIICLPGCSSPRYLTEEQDDEMRNVCDPHGCQVPYPAWVQIEEILKRAGAI